MRMQSQMLQESSNSNGNLSCGVEVLKLRTANEQLNQEKYQIEEALRNETLSNEEQRNYIMILRKAIDQKMDNLGILELVRASNPHSQDPVTIYTLLAELQRENDTWRKQCKSLEDQAQSSEERLRAESDINSKLRYQIEEIARVNQMLQEKLEKYLRSDEEAKKTLSELDGERKDLGSKHEKLLKQLEKSYSELQGEKLKHKATLQESDELKF
jgi:hypothetical protein